jgi:hypothetical protein
MIQVKTKKKHVILTGLDGEIPKNGKTMTP